MIARGLVVLVAMAATVFVRSEICPFGFTPLYADIVFAVDNSAAMPASAFTNVIGVLTNTTAEFGRYVAPGKLRVAIAQFASDVCSSRNPCSSYLSNPALVSAQIGGLVYSGTSTASVQQLLNNYIFGTLNAQRVVGTPTLVIILTAGSSSETPTFSFSSYWSPSLQIAVVDATGNLTTSRLASLISSNAAQTKTIAAAFAASSSAPTGLATTLACPGVC